MPKCKASLLLQSDSGEGKTTQLGEVAVWHAKRTGATLGKDQTLVGGERTLLYTMDFGGFDVLKPAVALGAIVLVDVSTLPDPFVWVTQAAQRKVPRYVTTGSGTPVLAGWIPAEEAYPGIKFGVTAYDSATSLSHLLMLDLARQSAEGKNLGGGSGYSFTQGSGADMVRIASNNPTHYNLAQTAVLRAMTQSQLHDQAYVIWTARLRRVEEEGTTQAVLGPQLAGKAMTAELPAWFTYTFRLAQETAFGQKTKHVLYYDDHVDKTAPTAKVLANGRIPLASTVQIPPRIDPANVPQLLELLEQSQTSALQNLLAKFKV